MYLLDSAHVKFDVWTEVELLPFDCRPKYKCVDRSWFSCRKLHVPYSNVWRLNRAEEMLGSNSLHALFVLFYKNIEAEICEILRIF